eukprot:UN12124
MKANKTWTDDEQKYWDKELKSKMIKFLTKFSTKMKENNLELGWDFDDQTAKNEDEIHSYMT